MKPMISYAQNGEDVILRRIFENQKTGFYVDIGASHPEFLSVTKHFYDQGWRGINIDPLKKSIELFTEARPRDLNLNLAIASEGGAREFFEVKDYPELSTFEASRSLTDKYHVTSYQVDIISGDQLFSEYITEDVDFMKIDVEGTEYEILSSINFLKYRPKILIVEATTPNATFPGWQNLKSIDNFEKWESLLVKSGYMFAYFDGLNRFYVSEENRQFLIYFEVGLCLWDNFSLQSQVKRIADLEWHCAERMKQIETLTEMLRESEADRAARLVQLEKLTEMLKKNDGAG